MTGLCLLCDARQLKIVVLWIFYNKFEQNSLILLYLTFLKILANIEKSYINISFKKCFFNLFSYLNLLKWPQIYSDFILNNFKL
jgi:hypothetical protein